MVYFGPDHILTDVLLDDVQHVSLNHLFHEWLDGLLHIGLILLNAELDYSPFSIRLGHILNYVIVFHHPNIIEVFALLHFGHSDLLQLCNVHGLSEPDDLEKKVHNVSVVSFVDLLDLLVELGGTESHLGKRVGLVHQHTH